VAEVPDFALYMVRDAPFGANFTVKLVITLIALTLVAWDRATRERWDYLWVFLVGTVIWTAAELSLQLREVRVLPESLLFGNEIPLGVSALLQGTSEGAFIAVLGLFLGDRLTDRTSRGRTILGFSIAVVLMGLLMVLQSARLSDADGFAASRRDMTDPQSVLAMAVVAVFVIWFWLRRPDFRERSSWMYASMAMFALIWTTISVAIGSRWIEVRGSAPGTYDEAGALLSLLALGYDVFVEIALAYVPFFAIPALLGWIQATQIDQVAVRQPENPSIPG
jgi:hypothetical protein